MRSAEQQRREAWSDQSTGEKGELLDFVIVGAGPHALAFACRLLESKPDSLYDEKDLTTRHKYHPVLSTKKKTKKASVETVEEKPMSFVAVDESGGWMRKWDDLMHNLDVHHLRSPLNAHPDPFDVTSLNAFAHEQGRSAELQCLGISPRSSGREDKKKVRDHAAYIFTNNDRIMLKVPSVPLFKSFCRSLITRYDLDSHLVQARVIRVEPCFDAPESIETRPTTKPSSFKVHLSTGQVLRSKRVVLATGQTQPRIPSWVPEQQITQPKGNTIIHSDSMRVNDPTFRRSIKNKRVLVVGGGITGYHLSRSAITAGASKITMVTRRHIKVQHFDVSLNWAGRYKKVHYSKFFGLSDPLERFKVLQEARGDGGGTVPPHMYNYLKEMHGWKSDGRFKLMEETQVEHIEWIPTNQECASAEAEGARQSRDEGDYWCVKLSTGQVLHVDYIWLATGRALDAEKEPLLGDLMRIRPIPLVHGLPVLHTSLRWCDDWEVYVLGAYAALQLGPDAINLAGARVGSLRVFDAVSSNDVVVRHNDDNGVPAEGAAKKSESWVCREEDLNPFSLLTDHCTE